MSLKKVSTGIVTGKHAARFVKVYAESAVQQLESAKISMVFDYQMQLYFRTSDSLDSSDQTQACRKHQST